MNFMCHEFVLDSVIYNFIYRYILCMNDDGDNVDCSARTQVTMDYMSL